MERRIRTGRRVAKISVLVIFALSLMTSPTWGQTGTISGEVVDADGEPFAGVLVRLQNDDGSIRVPAVLQPYMGGIEVITA